MPFTTPIFLICLALFLSASGLFLLGFRQGQAATIIARWGHILFGAGSIIVTILTFFAFAAPTGNGHDLHLTAVLFAAAVAWFSVIAWFVWNLKLIGAFTAPLIALLLMVDAFFSGWVASDAAYDLNLLPNSLVLQLHIATAIIGQAFAIGACGTSLMLLWQERKLKKRQIGDVPVSFPAMDSLGRALASCLWIGFIFITVGLLTGAIIVQTGVVSDGFSIAGKAAWAILVWGWYLTILVLQNILSYRPQKIARMSLIGFALLALTWFGMGFSALSGGAP